MHQQRKFGAEVGMAEVNASRTGGGEAEAATAGNAGAATGSEAGAATAGNAGAVAGSEAASNNARSAADNRSIGSKKSTAAGRRPDGGKGNAARNEAVRSAIIEALFALMESERFSSISVLQITDAAGVARMSYYRNFDSKEQVVEAYVDRLHSELIADGEERAASAANATSTQDANELLAEQALVRGFEQSLKRMRVEKRKILALINAGFATTLQQMMDGYLEERLGDMPARSIERYELYFASGALLNVLIKWLEQGAKEPPEEMAAFCAKLLRDGLSAS